jgi:uncharacterized protein YkwD
MRSQDSGGDENQMSAIACRIGRLLLLAMALASVAFPQTSVDTAGAQQLLELINQERTKQGVAPLVMNDGLTSAARKHSQKMAESETMLHQFDGEPPVTIRISDENVRADHDGENIAVDEDVSVAHTMLMRSPPHRENILGQQFNEVGIAIVKNGDLLYVTEDFAHVLPNYTDMEADAATQQAINDYVRSQHLPMPVRKPRTQLVRMACDMALDDKLDGTKTKEIPGVTGAVVWTATDLGKLPAGLKKVLAQPLSAGYSLGVCFAPSVSHPGGVYWLIMVVY